MARRSRDRSPTTQATLALARAGVEHVAHTYEHDPRAASYGLEAAQALGVDAARVLKTLLAEVDGRLAVAVVPVSAQLDLKALARALGGSRAVMADPAVAERGRGLLREGPAAQRRVGQVQHGGHVEAVVVLHGVVVAALELQEEGLELLAVQAEPRHQPEPLEQEAAQRAQRPVVGQRRQPHHVQVPAVQRLLE